MLSGAVNRLLLLHSCDNIQQCGGLIAAFVLLSVDVYSKPLSSHINDVKNGISRSSAMCLAVGIMWRIKNKRAKV